MRDVLVSQEAGTEQLPSLPWREACQLLLGDGASLLSAARPKMATVLAYGFCEAERVPELLLVLLLSSRGPQHNAC